MNFGNNLYNVNGTFFSCFAKNIQINFQDLLIFNIQFPFEREIIHRLDHYYRFSSIEY